MITILLRIIPYSIFIRLYYYFFKKKKEVFFSSLDTDKYRSLHNIDNLLRYKTSDKLFIIGSGYSLNNLSETDWKEINSHDVFGFNFSFLNNDHIPTFYACEAMAPMSTNEFGRISTADIFFQMYKSKCEKYRNVIKVLTDLDES